MPYFTNRGITPLPSGAWSPLTVSAAFWYDASTASTTHVDGSNHFTSWDDRSGNGRTLTPSGPFNTDLVASVKNGLSGALFLADGSNGSVMTTTSTFTLAQPFTIVFAMKVGDNSAFQTLTAFSTICGDGTLTAVAMLTRVSGTSPGGLFCGGAGAPMPSTLTASTAYTLYGQYTSTASVGGVNGIAGTPGDAGTGSFSSANFQLGRNDGNGFAGHVLEVFGFPGVNGTNLSDSLTYLTGKWGAF